MFDGTDLNMAYGGFTNAGSSLNYEQQMQAPVQIQTMQQAPPPPKPVVVESPKAPEVYAPSAMYAMQGPAYWPQQESVWDRFASKKIEVFKLVVLSFVFVLALSFDHLLKHYLEQYIGSGFLTANQELLVRLCYPVAIVLILWIIKVFA